MDPPTTAAQTVRLLVDIDRALDRRLEGRVRTAATDAWTPFSGVLELLKVLENLAEGDDLGSSSAGAASEPNKQTP